MYTTEHEKRSHNTIDSRTACEQKRCDLRLYLERECGLPRSEYQLYRQLGGIKAPYSLIGVLSSMRTSAYIISIMLLLALLPWGFVYLLIAEQGARIVLGVAVVFLLFGSVIHWFLRPHYLYFSGRIVHEWECGEKFQTMIRLLADRDISYKFYDTKQIPIRQGGEDGVLKVIRVKGDKNWYIAEVYTEI